MGEVVFGWCILERIFAKVNIQGTVAHKGVWENSIWIWVDGTLVRVVMNEKGFVFHGNKQSL